MYAGGRSDGPRTRQELEICSAGSRLPEEADPERERRGKPVVKTTHLVGDVKQDVAAIPPVTAWCGMTVQVADM